MYGCFPEITPLGGVGGLEVEMRSRFCLEGARVPVGSFAASKRERVAQVLKKKEWVGQKVGCGLLC